MRNALLSGLVLLATCLSGPALAQTAPVEGDCTLKDFKFASGESLPELRVHYATLGTPGHDAVLILHGTTGDGKQFLRDAFAGKLFGPGQLLDASRYFIVLPDGIGHGRSSRPSDGRHMRFPKYTYDDMVRAQHDLLTQCLKVDHLRLVTGTSMGGMHTWVWGYTYPDFMDALMPLASAPVEIAGRNRMMRKMILDSITGDPEWKQGEYKEQPRGLVGEIRAPLYAVNSADDEVNPPELGILEEAIRKVPKGRYILLPTSPETRGHGTHSLPAVWGKYLEELLRASAR